MSEFEEILNTGQQSINNFDTSKIFIGNNKYASATYTNGTPGEITLPAGTVLGRVNASGKVDALQSGASDGSQYPVGILAHDVTVAAAGSATVAFCVAGDVAEEKVDFLDSYDSLDTIVDGRTLRDRIAADTMGIYIKAGTELTDFDNQ